jgi:hypothetical protein
MGNNFLMTQAERHRKAWAAKFAQASRDMLAKPVGKLGLKVVAKLRNGPELRPGEFVLLMRKEKSVLVCRENQALADVAQPPAEFERQLVDCAGVMVGEVEEVHRRAKAVSVRILGAK